MIKPKIIRDYLEEDLIIVLKNKKFEFNDDCFYIKPAGLILRRIYCPDKDGIEIRVTTMSKSCILPSKLQLKFLLILGLL